MQSSRLLAYWRAATHALSRATRSPSVLNLLSPIPTRHPLHVSLSTPRRKLFSFSRILLDEKRCPPLPVSRATCVAHRILLSRMVARHSAYLSSNSITVNMENTQVSLLHRIFFTASIVSPTCEYKNSVQQLKKKVIYSKAGRFPPHAFTHLPEEKSMKLSRAIAWRSLAAKTSTKEGESLNKV